METTARTDPSPASAETPVGASWWLVAALVVASATAVGVASLTGSQIGAEVGEAFRQIAANAPSTVPTGMAVLASFGVNVAAGTVLVRWLRGRPFSAPVDAVLEGIVGAVVLDVMVLATLGSVGWFERPWLAVMHAGIIVAGARRLRPLWTPNRGRVARPPMWFVAVALGSWGTVVVLQLASPVVPFLDVLPNHVAPVEHVSAFGGLASLDVTPSPIYGPSRQFIGYVASLSLATVASGGPAAAAVAAAALPLAAALALSVRVMSARWLGERAAAFALLTMPLTFVFLRLPDARATVGAFVGAGAAAAADRLEPGRARLVGLTVAVTATIYVHPLIGALVCATLVVAAVARAAGLPDPDVAVAIGSAALATAPQILTTLGIGLPAWTPAVAILMAVGVAVVGHRTDIRLGRAPAIAAAVVGLAGAAWGWRGVDDAVRMTVTSFPLVALLAAAATASLTSRARRAVAAALAVWVLGTAVVAAIASQDAFWGSVRFEIPKTMLYWVPWVWAAAAAGGLASWWGHRFGRLAVIAALAVAAFPVRAGEAGIDNAIEHRTAETWSIALRHAARGYWVGYPDARHILDERRTALVGVIRDRITSGALSADDAVLQVAPSFQQWVRTPIDVFTGAVVTSVSADPEYSGHTRGGRLFGLDDLDAQLDRGYRLVVVEGELIPAVAPSIASAGYSIVWRGDGAEVYGR